MEAYAEDPVKKEDIKWVQVVSFDIGIRNFAYCIANVATNEPVKIKYLEVIDLGCKPKGPVQSIIDACLQVMDEIVYQKLDLNLETVVLIESQMTSVMKCIQTAINVFFKMIMKYDSVNVATKYLSARHKLQLIEKFKDYAPPTVSTTSQYRKNKLDSVHFASWLLEHQLRDSKHLERLKSMKKKDDAADTLCMVMYYAHTMA